MLIEIFIQTKIIFMKTFLLSIAIIFLGVSFTNAQSFHAGIKVGANINKLTGQSFKEQFSFGYHAGAFAEIGLGKKWSIQPEVLFNQTNTDTSDKFSALYKVNAGEISKIKLGYISIPVLLNYKVSKIFSIQAGPQYGILISQEKSILQNGKDAFKKGDFSLVGGAQLKLVGIRFFGRYQIGLSNLNDIDNKDKWKNQVIQLGVGFSLF